MKPLRLVGLLAAGALGLSACGAQATVHQAVDSLGASPYLQVTLTGSLAGSAPGLADAAAVAKDLSVTMDYASTNGASLAQAGANVDADVVVAVSGTTALEVRSIGGNLYVELDLAPLAGLPGVNVPAGQLQAANALLGGRWYEVPQSLLASLAAAHRPTAAQLAQSRSLARRVVKALSTLIDAAPYTSSNGTFTVTGTLQSVASALGPILAPTTGAAASSVPGTYSLSLSTSGGQATGATLTLSGLDATTNGGPSSIELDASVAHAAQSVATPSDAVVVTPSMLSQLSTLGA